MPGHAGNVQAIGEHVEEFALGDPALAGDVVRLAARARIVGCQNCGIGHDPGIDGAQRIVSFTDNQHPAAAKFSN